MNIITRNQWGAKVTAPLQKLNLAKVNAIALHHMASPTADIYEVQRWHLNSPNNWRCLGYHYWVGFDGKIYEGRGFEHVGAGVANQNDRIISIGFQGNYQSGLANIPLSPPMPDAQFNAGVDIINFVRTQVMTAHILGGHSEFMATACPGDMFPLEEMKALKKRNSGYILSSSVDDLMNELVWRGIVSDVEMWRRRGNEDVNLRYFYDKYYHYMLFNGGSVKADFPSLATAMDIFVKQGIVSNVDLWMEKMDGDDNLMWLFRKLAAYVN